jgi:hypothetical protein
VKFMKHFTGAQAINVWEPVRCSQLQYLLVLYWFLLVLYLHDTSPAPSVIYDVCCEQKQRKL